ncbi:hypothetical protein ACSDQ9_00080 [Aestuariimicrobium soli]|uniref:hypothetical protein n=1 Tax=Aestuariimicrobium soli TaxID=2035834 RepID=UPI003EBD1AC7
MPRRVNLPGANELFRPTDPRPRRSRTTPDAEPSQPTEPTGPTGAAPAATGRVRHDEKITVYVSSDELIALERARLDLRAQGVVADRGKLVRTAIAMALSGLAADGADSELVRRLAGE